MTIEEIKRKWLEIIQSQNEIKSRVLDDFSECPELYVAIYGEFPDWYFLECQNEIDKTINNIRERYAHFIPRTFISYKYNKINKESGEVVFDENAYDSNILLEEAYIYLNKEGITVYTKNKELAEEIFKCAVPIHIEHPCEVFWVSQGQRGFEATKLVLKDGNFDVGSHYNDDFDYSRVKSFINSEESGLIILHGAPGTGNYLKYSVLFILV